MKRKILGIACAVNGLAIVGTGLYGVFAPGAAMNMMTGLEHHWDPETVSLMRMHNGADFGLGVGFLLVALKPERSFSALVLCLFANLAHGVVHVLDQVEGRGENAGPIAVLVVMSVVIAALYPWKEGFERWRAA